MIRAIGFLLSDLEGRLHRVQAILKLTPRAKMFEWHWRQFLLSKSCNWFQWYISSWQNVTQDYLSLKQDIKYSQFKIRLWQVSDGRNIHSNTVTEWIIANYYCGSWLLAIFLLGGALIYIM